MTVRLSCGICGIEDPAVELALVAWKEPPLDDGRVFDFIPRCRDRKACRARCERQGEAWPIQEGPRRAA